MKKTFYLLTFLTAVIVLFPQCQQASQEKKAKYVFYFIGDGMGVNQVNGTEMYLAEKEGYIGIKPLNFTQFPVIDELNIDGAVTIKIEFNHCIISLIQ